MRLELHNQDWELMILHYLGLDHIGHVEGPFSKKVPLKLKEMDDVIAEIVKSTKLWVSAKIVIKMVSCMRLR